MHNLIVGNSFTGKTNLCKRLADNFTSSGLPVIVYDPIESHGWPITAKKFSSAGKFLDYIATAKSAYVFTDESKTLWDYDTAKADALVYKGRHRGLLVFMIAQRTRMIPPNARNQCSTVYAFRQQLDDAKTLSAEYHPDLMLTTDLDNGEFYAMRARKCVKHSLDYTGGMPPIIARI